MKIYIDENMPHQLAKALNTLQQVLNKKERTQLEVLSIKEVFGVGAKDEKWIPIAGKQKAIVITQDYHIQTTRHQRDLCEQYNLGMLYIKPPSKNGFAFWDMAKLLVKRWDEVRKIIKKDKPPFAYRCTSRTTFEKLEK